MDLVAMILERYGIADPAAGNAIGEFTNPELQDLFDDLLVPMAGASLTGAPSAGATIDNLDILHLEHILAHSEFDDINLIAQNMVAGSRNHMRGFVGVLEQRGLTYEAQYIEQSQLDSILSSPMETAAIYDEDRDVLAECGKRRA